MDHTNNSCFFSERTRKEEEDYKNSWKKEKALYWTDFVQNIFHHVIIWKGKKDIKIDIPSYRKHKPDVDLFLDDMVTTLQENFCISRKEVLKYFVLDEQAKTILKIQKNISQKSQEVNKVIHPNEKLRKILWTKEENISYKELIERIWDLYYDSLSSFLLELWSNIWNKEVSTLLKEASEHIASAWEICLPYIRNDFAKMKHTKEIKWINSNKKEVAKNISMLDDSDIWDFLKALSTKIQKDWEADKKRGRTQLSTELFAAANGLKKASNLMN